MNNPQSIKIRINNIEFITRKPDDISSGEFIIWEKNKYYGNRDGMLAAGWVETESGVVKEGNYHIHNSMFEQAELCYTVGYLRYDKREGCCDLKSVGPRVLNLSEEDRVTFFEVYGLAEKKMKEANNHE